MLWLIQCLFLSRWRLIILSGQSYRFSYTVLLVGDLRRDHLFDDCLRFLVYGVFQCRCFDLNKRSTGNINNFAFRLTHILIGMILLFF